MLVKKYPQAHLLVTIGEVKIIIDPGNITFQNGYKPEEFQGMDAYLITHTHADHIDPENIKEVVGNRPVFANSDVVNKLKEFGVDVIETKDRVEFEVSGLKITPVDLPHGKLPEGWGEAPPNTGFLIEGVLFHPGDGNIAPLNLESKNVALPIAGPSINYDSALKFARDLKCKVAIPIHFSSKNFHGDPQEFKVIAEKEGIDVRPLNFGESTEI